MHSKKSSGVGHSCGKGKRVVRVPDLPAGMEELHKAVDADVGTVQEGVSPDSTEDQAEPMDRNEAVVEINAELRKQDGGNLRIGKIVDRVIGPAGRGNYGKHEIANLAADPDIMCTAEHLRQCWHYYRLMHDHGKRLSEFSMLKFGHLYQISRLLQLEDENSAEKIAIKVYAMANHAMDHGKGGKPMPAEALARAVTTEITGTRGRGDEAAPQKPVNKQPETDGLPTAADDHAVLNDNLGAIEVAAKRIASSDKYDHACVLQTNVEQVAQTYIAILGLIARHDPQSLAITDARKRIATLAKLVGLQVVDAGASAGNEVAL